MKQIRDLPTSKLRLILFGNLNLLNRTLKMRISLKSNLRSDIHKNSDLYYSAVQADSKTIFTQLLYSYKLNPQSVLFIGYSDNNLGYAGIDVLQTDRTFFLKLGYGWFGVFILGGIFSRMGYLAWPIPGYLNCPACLIPR